MSWEREPEDDYGAGDVVDYVPAEETNGANGTTEHHYKPDQTFDEFLNEEEPEYDWLIPGVLERGDRVILTGDEGKGKSTLLRQICVQSCSGIHPFTGDKMDPLRVLLIDFENSRRQIKRKLRPLRIAAGDALDNSLTAIRVLGEGLDLLRDLDQEWLRQRVAANNPDLLVIGPLYKLAAGDPVEEKVARPVALFLDKLRRDHGFAILMEAHTPHASSPGGKRPERPYGASLWLRWPEFGIYLAESGAIRHWRGARDEREWPEALKRGGAWPWTPAVTITDLKWAGIAAELRAAGEELSFGELARRLGGHKEQVSRAVKANQYEYQHILKDFKE